MELQTITIGSTVYHPTEQGKPLVGKLLSLRAPFFRNASTRGIGKPKAETPEQHRARVYAAMAKANIARGETERSACYLGRPDGMYVLRATDGHRAAFEVGEGIGKALTIASTPTACTFKLNTALYDAIKRAQIVASPNKYITLHVNPHGILVSAFDGDGCESSERVEAMIGGEGSIRIDVGYLLDVFRVGALASLTNDDKTSFQSLYVDVGDWRYVVAGVRK